VTHKFTGTLFLAAACVAMSALPLGAVSLDSLLGGAEGSANSLTVGDINFYDFGFSASCANSGLGVTSCAALVADGDISGIFSESNPGALQITPNTSGGLDGFTITGSLTVDEADGAPTTLDITLTYDAAVIGGAATIGDVYLEASNTLNPPCVAPGPCAANPSIGISETITNGGNQIGIAQVTDPPPVLSDEINLTQVVSSLSVLKDIDLNSGGGTNGGSPDFASVTSIAQQLSQVPEPRAYAAVLGLFFALFFVIKRRRQQTA
jgi:hypothetical protein